MGEIDTKPIESVQVALSLFEEKADQRKSRATSFDPELGKEQELEGLLKDIANCKVQLESKDSAYMQVLLKLDHYQKTAEELSTLVKNSEVERDKYINECIESRNQVDELESKMKEMTDQLLEAAKTREQLSHVLSELKAVQEELLRVETELAEARESEMKVRTLAELMETAANMEKGKTDELLKHVSELNEAILQSKLAAIEAEKENSAVLSKTEAELQLVTATLVQAQQQLEELRKQIDKVQDLENELLSKSVFIDMLQLELREACELQSLSEKAASDAIENLNRQKSEFELKERESSDQAVCINSQEMELSWLKIELKNANAEVGHLNYDIEMLTGDLERMRTEIDEIRARENEAQIEIALLKSELHKGRSKIAAAEAAEARAERVKSGLYLAVQQLALEAEEAKMESQRLKQGADEAKDITGEMVFINPRLGDASENVELHQTDESKKEAEVTKDNLITISITEFQSLIKKAEERDQITVLPLEDSCQSATNDNRNKEEVLKELEIAMVKIAEFRTRAEQAVSRAEMAEKAKAALEQQLRKHREQRQRRRAALAALREESVPKESSIPIFEQFEQTPATYQPLNEGIMEE